MDSSRRNALKAGMLGIAVSSIPQAFSSTAEQETPKTLSPGKEQLPWGKGIEGQRKGDLGNGYFLNPIMAGDYPDPTILKDGNDYYMTFSAFENYPALIIWHSQDLVNWTPLAPALEKPIGSIFAVDLVKHQNRYYIYIPVLPTAMSPDSDHRPKIYVIHAEKITGPWSEPIDLQIPGLIDPGHIVGEDGKRYLFLSGVSRVRLSDDGLSTEGPVTLAYEGWKYPDEWITEAFSLESPKLLKHGEFFYLITAEGGTSGPATGHMVNAARSRSVLGPWENCPHNPIVRTNHDSERWWSRGHASLIEGPGKDWWMVYHGYENGFRGLGRQTLLDPIEWTADGWFQAKGADLSSPIAKPAKGKTGDHGIAKSDDFAVPAFGVRWNFYNPGHDEKSRAFFEDNTLVLQGKGLTPTDASPLAVLTGDHHYEVTVRVELMGEATGGLLLFFNKQLYLGMGHDGDRMTTYKSGRPSYWPEPAPAGRVWHLRIVNNRHIVTFYYSTDGANWTRHALRSEVSGYNVNVADDLASLRPALFSCGKGSVRFSDFQYRALA
jgi:xylan 1,4-beta-xylosidase